MLMVRGEIWGCTAFTGDSGASRFTFFPLDRAVKVILMFVLGNLKVHLQQEKTATRFIKNISTRNYTSEDEITTQTSVFTDILLT